MKEGKEVGDGQETWSVTDPGEELELYSESSEAPLKSLKKQKGISDDWKEEWAAV